MNPKLIFAIVTITLAIIFGASGALAIILM